MRLQVGSNPITCIELVDIVEIFSSTAFSSEYNKPRSMNTSQRERSEIGRGGEEEGKMI